VKNNLYTLFYALTMGTICAVLLTGVGQATKPYKDANARDEKMRNIVFVLGAVEEGASKADIQKAYEESVTEVKDDDVVQRYVYSKDGVEQSIAIPLAGPGLWGPIKGFLSLDPDKVTIRGVTFHEQEETPGLGGEIASPDFRNQFVGKKIISTTNAPGIDIIQGGDSSAQNVIDGITGATMTCDKVEDLINDAIIEFKNAGESNGG